MAGPLNDRDEKGEKNDEVGRRVLRVSPIIALSH